MREDRSVKELKLGMGLGGRKEGKYEGYQGGGGRGGREGRGRGSGKMSNTEWEEG